ncbi:VC_2705 family sodium/solute symporter [Parvibium lacunae]|uniref:Cation acetate symporter n=1 Tax=Parvibium lacunae TaxID=1888893 RepID=A0A368L363_9BURK|nr:VC_2705 family sodium/solute symporter [Parvibium lacunae]RCS58031.1 cation acetate symporter [Parvibium lacunae]
MRHPPAALVRNYLLLVLGLLIFLASTAWLENQGISAAWLGYLFLFATIALYAIIGLFCRTSQIDEYYVAGRRIPAVFNGMATAADWISAASFIGLVGTLYVTGYDGLAYVLGWTGGYVLVALLIAPYLRELGGFTVPEFLGRRFASRTVRFAAVLAVLLCSFIYLVAQIQGIGLITQRFVGVEFTVGVFLGLAGVLVCSFLGGMRAITWTQVAQYLILLIAFVLPTAWVAWQQTASLSPLTVLQRSLATIATQESRLRDDPAEQQVQQALRKQAANYQAKIDQLPVSYNLEKQALEMQIMHLRQDHASLREIKAAEKQLSQFPVSPEEANRRWQEARDQYLKRAEPPGDYAQPYTHSSNLAQASTQHYVSAEAARQQNRLNFIALLFCLMLGTASMPHILTRYLTTPTVASARQSVAWTLFFILLLYLATPILAALVKAAVMTDLVGSSLKALPTWLTSLKKLDVNFAHFTDWNHDGILQYAELSLHPDIVMLALPSMFGLPSVIAGLIAAGALAAALSTADGLLLTLANTMSHDVYFARLHPQASTQRRVTIAKITLLVVALLAAYVTSLKPGNILSVVGAAFSLAASSLFPALIMAVFFPHYSPRSIFWGMLTGTALCLFYMFAHYPLSANLLGWQMGKWAGIEPVAAAVFGVPAGFITIACVEVFYRFKRSFKPKKASSRTAK